MNHEPPFSDEHHFSDGGPPKSEVTAVARDPWKVLIVDDVKAVHTVTRVFLARFAFEGRGLAVLSAYSAEEAKSLLHAHPDTAVILLDVAMEQNDSGLLLARYIREVLGNRFVRIILRTGGLPGMAPLEKVIVDYDINGYTEKIDLTAQKLFTIIISALRSYRDIMESAALSTQLREEIAERMQAEDKLRASEEMYSSIFTHIGIGISLISPEMEIIFMNPTMKNWFPQVEAGKRPICYKSFNVPPRDGICTYCPTIQTFHDGQVHISVTDTPTEDGICHFRIISTPVLSATGSVTAVIEAVEDITERKRSDEELRSKEICLQGILEATDDGILAIDEKGNIIKANRKFAELWKIPQSMINSGDDDTLLNFVLDQLQDPEAFVKKVRSLYGSPDSDMDRLFFKDGRIFERNSAPLIQEGSIIGRVWSFRDITEKRKMEEDILRAQKLESVGLLAGGIAHDFNNLLTAILGNISLAKMQLPADNRTHARLCEAEKASLRARDLTQQLLTFAKGGAPVRRSASVSELIRETACFALSGSNVRCDFAIGPDLPLAEIDEGQISQVIHNLIINADQSMPVGGAIRIACEEVTLVEAEVPPLVAGRYIRISVGDQGVGIPAEHLPRIFDPYFTTKEKGRGLGLAGAYSIILNHDGQISVSSEPGAGTTFIIHLPISDMAPVMVPAEEGGLRTGTGRILVMDDEETVLEIAGEMLSHLGYESVFARDGGEAIELYLKAREAGFPFRAILADLTIPGGIGGREMVEALGEIDPEIRAIVSSGYCNDPVMSDFRSYGFCGVISKPYRIGEMSKLLSEVLPSGDE